MFRIPLSRSRPILFASVIPVVSATTGENPGNGNETVKTETKEFVFVETGWDRVRRIFKST